MKNLNKEKLAISACSSCGSSAIRRVKGNWSGNFKGKDYAVPPLEYFACPICDEKIYPPEAMQRIQENSPAYAKPRPTRQALNLGGW